MNYQGPCGSAHGIEWLQPPVGRGYTWNPVTGCTNDFCEVRLICWAREQAMRHGDGAFRPKLHTDRIREPLHHKAPALIAAVLSGDFFSEGVPYDWVVGVLDIIELAPQHTFMILTKNVTRLCDFRSVFENLPNLWIGTTITSRTSMARVTYLQSCGAHHRFISFEPLREGIALRYEELDGIEWVIIGGQSRPSVQPETAWVNDVYGQAWARGIPVLVKRNAGLAYPPREWPRAMLAHLISPKEMATATITPRPGTKLS